MTTEIFTINLCFTPSKFTGSEIKEITAKVQFNQTKNDCNESSTETTAYYSKTELQDKTLNEVYEYVLGQAKQTLERDIEHFPVL
ncbi:MAG TPA: hypothetical protein HPP97_09760 [Desulfuromonadales bacterium]|nr:hypothetical protein [Desulfuromonadales bacterium]